MKGSAALAVGLALSACRGAQGPPTSVRVGPIVDDGSPTGPVLAAAKAGNLETTRRLIEAGANPRERDVYGKTPLHDTTSAEVAGFLLDHGVSPDVRSNSGETPLMTETAASPVVERLLQAGARPNLRDGDGRTALQHAVRLSGMENVTSIVTLCAYGADPLIRDEKGTNAADLARRYLAEKLGVPDQNAVIGDLLAPDGACFALAARPSTARATAAERAAVLLESRCRATADAWACGRLGWAYEHGEGVAKDLERSAKLYEQSCDRGYAWGCNALAYACAHGLGLPKDLVRATQLARRSCDLGYNEGCGQLARQVQLGLGVARDEARALPLFEKACSGGDAWACWQLGEAYAEGKGTPRNVSRASELRQRACTAGEKRACGGTR